MLRTAEYTATSDVVGGGGDEVGAEVEVVGLLSGFAGSKSPTRP